MLKFKMDAIDWIVGKDPEFLNYCKMLGMDSDTIRNKIIKMLICLTHKNKNY